MSELDDRFEQAAVAVKGLATRPDDQTMLKLYALYKQGSSGDVSGTKPGFFDFVGAAKYEAWEKLRGTEPEEAQAQYVDLVRKLGGTLRLTGKQIQQIGVNRLCFPERNENVESGHEAIRVVAECSEGVDKVQVQFSARLDFILDER